MTSSETPQTLSPSSDERLMAAISHFFGLVVALIVWATQKDKSRFVRFQALQAAAFDVLFLLLWFVIVGCYMAFMAFSMFGAMMFGSSMASDPSTQWIFLMPSLFPMGILCIFPFILLLFVARIVAAVQTFQGKDFRYPWLAERVEKFLE